MEAWKGSDLLTLTPMSKKKPSLLFPHCNPAQEQLHTNIWLHTRNATSPKTKLPEGSRCLLCSREEAHVALAPRAHPTAHHPATAGKQEPEGTSSSYPVTPGALTKASRYSRRKHVSELSRERQTALGAQCLTKNSPEVL